MSELAQWVANNGLAVVIVIAGGIALWKTAGWMAVNVITPAKDAFIEHLHSIGSFMNATTKSLESTAKSIDVISEQMKCIRQDVDNISTRLDERIETLSNTITKG